jgi:oxysterol-binding protein 1
MLTFPTFIFSSEYSNTEDSDDVGKQETCELSDGDEFHFYDTRQSFSDCAASPDLRMRCLNLNYGNEDDKFGKTVAIHQNNEYLPFSIKRRTKLPEPVEKEKGVSLWSMIKDNVGKDLTRVCLPVYFNEPLSSLQKCFEDLEYSHLLDRAYECGLRVCFFTFHLCCDLQVPKRKMMVPTLHATKFFGETLFCK